MVFIENDVTVFIEDRHGFVDHEVAFVVGNDRHVVDDHKTLAIDFENVDRFHVFANDGSVLVENVLGQNNFVDKFNLVAGKSIGG
jgi:hypothetical protein